VTATSSIMRQTIKNTSGRIMWNIESLSICVSLVMSLSVTGCSSKESKFNSCLENLFPTECMESGAFAKIQEKCCSRAGLPRSDCGEPYMHRVVTYCSRCGGIQNCVETQHNSEPFYSASPNSEGTRATILSQKIFEAEKFPFETIIKRNQ
jgi:hypothetical protein